MENRGSGSALLIKDGGTLGIARPGDAAARSCRMTARSAPGAVRISWPGGSCAAPSEHDVRDARVNSDVPGQRRPSRADRAGASGTARMRTVAFHHRAEQQPDAAQLRLVARESRSAPATRRPAPAPRWTAPGSRPSSTDSSKASWPKMRRHQERRRGRHQRPDHDGGGGRQPRRRVGQRVVVRRGVGGECHVMAGSHDDKQNLGDVEAATTYRPSSLDVRQRRDHEPGRGAAAGCHRASRTRPGARTCRSWPRSRRSRRRAQPPAAAGGGRSTGRRHHRPPAAPRWTAWRRCRAEVADDQEPNQHATPATARR